MIDFHLKFTKSGKVIINDIFNERFLRKIFVTVFVRNNFENKECSTAIGQKTRCINGDLAWKSICYPFYGWNVDQRLYHKLEFGLFLVLVDRYCVLWIFVLKETLRNELQRVDSFIWRRHNYHCIFNYDKLKNVQSNPLDFDAYWQWYCPLFPWIMIRVGTKYLPKM